MGSTDGDADQAPVRQITLSPYCIDGTEVTVGSYGQCVSSGGCPPAPTTVNSSEYSASDAQFWSQFCNGSRVDRREHPVNCVDWTMADDYCRWRGGRLPTEAEWEFAARSNDGRTYPWGNQAPNGRLLNAVGSEANPGLTPLGRAWNVSMYTDSDGWPFTAPVGSFPAGASPFGVLDMAGNVWEWTSDWYGGYAAGPATNPSGPSAGQQRVARGGGWGSDGTAGVRASFRNWRGPGIHDFSIGFRCARGVAR